MVIIGNSKSGKTKLLFKFLLENYLEFKKLECVSPSLFQKECEVIIKVLQNGLSINKNRTIFELHKPITNIDSAFNSCGVCPAPHITLHDD